MCAIVNPMHYFNHIEMLCETRYYCLTIKLDLKFIVDLAIIISVLFLVSIFDELIHHSDHCIATNTLTEIFTIYCHRNRFDSDNTAYITSIYWLCWISWPFVNSDTRKDETFTRSHRNAVWKPMFLSFLREGEGKKTGKRNQMNCKL